MCIRDRTSASRGLTVATPREAEVMADLTDDLLLAYPPVGRSKVARVLDLPASVDLLIGLDSEPALEALARACWTCSAPPTSLPRS